MSESFLVYLPFLNQFYFSFPLPSFLLLHKSCQIHYLLKLFYLLHYILELDLQVCQLNFSVTRPHKMPLELLDGFVKHFLEDHQPHYHRKILLHLLSFVVLIVLRLPHLNSLQRTCKQLRVE